MAATTVIQEKFFRLGTRKYLTPSRAPGRVTEYTLMTRDSTTRMGIMNRDTRSMPFSTPAKMMARVMAVKTRKQTSEDRPLEIKALK